MKSWYHLSMLGLLAISLTSCSTQKSPSEIANQLDDSVVLISYPDRGGHGTGFFVPGDSDQCSVLTARHVVADQEVLKLKTRDGTTREVNNILPFQNQDLALLTFSPDEGKCPYQALEFGNSDTVQRAQLLYISGFFNNGGRLINHFVDGGVTAIDNLPEGYGIAYQAWTTKGMSGSPVVDTTGKVVAIHGRSDVEITRLAEIEGFQKPQLQALNEEEIKAEGVKIGTFKWGIPINLYLDIITNYKISINQANDLLASKKYDQAVKLYDEAITLNPNFADAWNGRGASLVNLERYEEALESYNKAIELDPNFADAWYYKGISLGNLERHEEALESYNKAIELDPNFTYAWYYKGNSLGDLERYEEALKSFDKAVELDPDFAYAWSNRGRSLNDLERYKEALESSSKAIEIDSNNPNTWSIRGVSLGNLERYEEALESYDQAIELDPDDALAIKNRQLLLEKMSQ